MRHRPCGETAHKTPSIRSARLIPSGVSLPQDVNIDHGYFTTGFGRGCFWQCYWTHGRRLNPLDREIAAASDVDIMAAPLTRRQFQHEPHVPVDRTDEHVFHCPGIVKYMWGSLFLKGEIG